MFSKLLPTTLLALSMSTAFTYSVQAADTTTQVSESAQQQLQQKLSLVKGFSASFSQVVIDTDGNTVQNSTGTIAVQRPNLIHWETFEPDETLVVSDGETLWFYNPFVEQVSAFNVANAVTNTPILLLSGSSDETWNDYLVKKINDNEFRIEAKSDDSQVRSLHLVFKNEDLTKFTVMDATGQLSHFNLDNIVKSPLPKASLFKFSLPEGVDFDDQR